jgi:hypothetical protein
MIFRYEPHQTGHNGPARPAEKEFAGAARARSVLLEKRVKRKLRAASGRRG